MALLALSNAGVPAHFSIFWLLFYGAKKHHRHDKVFGCLVITRHSKMKSRGWMMRSELRSEVLVGRVALATMDRSFEGTIAIYDTILDFICWFHIMLSLCIYTILKSMIWFPSDGFSFIIAMYGLEYWYHLMVPFRQ